MTRVLTTVVFGFVFFMHSGVARAKTEIGRLAVVTGDVKIAKDANDNAGREAQANDPIFNGDVVKTGSGAMAKVLFTDQSIMDVGPNSAFKVTDYDLKQGDNRTGTFNLMYGKLRALVTQQVGDDGDVKVKTKDAVMGVRGTEFVVAQPLTASGTVAPTQIVVVSGRVAVTPPNGGPPVVVAAGQMVTSAASTNATSGSSASSGGAAASGSSDGGSLQVSTVTADQMSSATQGAKAEDNTFLSAVTIAPQNNQGGSSNKTQNSQTAAMTKLATNTMSTTTALTNNSGPPRIDVPVLNNTNFLPPANIIVGGLVRLTISVQ